MDLDLDLGSSTIFNVSIDGKVYKLPALSVRKFRKLQKEIKNKKEDVEELDIFLNLLVELGLPELVVDKLDLVQAKMISDKVIGVKELSEKK